jgi:hypothetical protein
LPAALATLITRAVADIPTAPAATSLPFNKAAPSG